MVLAELGSQIKGAINKLQSATVIDEEALDAVLKEICAALMHSDVNIRIVQKIRTNIKAVCDFEELAQGTNKRKLIQQAVHDELVRSLEAERNAFKPKKGKRNVIMFVGLQGSGKTTTCTKYCYHYIKRGWKVAMVCADTFRAGAFDQLKQNAMKIKCPFYGSYTETDPVAIAEEGVRMFSEEKYELIIVDTSGRHKQESALFEEMQQVAEVVMPDDVIFVMDSSIGQAVHDQATAFNDAIDVGSCIVTKLDGHAKGGGALSAVGATQSPIVFIGTGEHFDDFEQFEAESFVKRLLGMGDVSGLLNSMKEAGLDGEAGTELLQKMSDGIFTLRDMYEQFQNIMRMGPLSQVLSMIPGLPQGAAGQTPEQQKAGSQRLKNFCTMMDSMTDAELDSEKTLDLQNDMEARYRVMRIARGSGRHPQEVLQLLDEHKRFSKMVGKMGKLGKGKGANWEQEQMKRNPKQMMAQLQVRSPPSSLLLLPRPPVLPD